jgi:hypothetical protein
MDAVDNATRTSTTSALAAPAVETRWLAIFEDRYGAGSYERLLTFFQRPCVTYAQIGAHYGVTRERVRQWHVEMLPGAPRGHERQRLCVVYHQKKRLLEDPLFRSFYQHARDHFPAGGIELIPTRAGFRRRLAKLGRWTVALKSARRQSPHGRRRHGKTAYTLTNCSRPVDFVYYQLSATDYLLVPRSAIPLERTTFLDTPVSKYQRYRNNFGVCGLESIAHVS